jgi:RNA polymerase sigma-70 factor (ECF subfamily)
MSDLLELSDGGQGPFASWATSRSLLELARENDAAAWERLVSLYAPLVFHWCRRWDLQEQDTADIFQEVFQAVAMHLAGFRKTQPGDTFRGWLRTITRNKIHDFFRRRGRQPRCVGGPDAQQRLAQLPAPQESEEDSGSEEVEDRRLFLRALNLIRGEFEERTWQAFWRTTVDGQTSRQAAAELAMTSGAVRVAKSRVLQRLREELGDLLEE